MSRKSANRVFDEVHRRLGSAESLLVVTHARPDGDGLGSMAALARCGRAADKAVHLLVPWRVPGRYLFLFPEGGPASANDFDVLADRVDLVVLVDTCALAQLDGLADSLAKRRSKIVVIDHHNTADDISDTVWRDTSAAAAGIMVGELVDALGWPVDLPAAVALATAVTTDTGWMRFPSTDARCLRAVADWVQRGVRLDRLYRRLYESDRPERLQLIARTLQGLELHCHGKLAAMTVRASDFLAVGALPEETENLVNEAMRMGAIEAAMLLVETDDAVRVSLRSRDDVDVSAIARQFGGGGHRRASGLRSQKPLDAVREELVEAFRAVIERGE